MARPSSHTHSTTVASINTAWGAGFFTAIAAFPNTGVWTLSAQYPGTNSINLVLKAPGGMEVLLHITTNNQFLSTTVYTDYYGGENQINALNFGVAREGGYEAAFIAGFDPVNQDFWDHITDTLGLAQPSTVHPIYTATNLMANVDFYFVFDDTTAMCALHVGNRTGNVHYDTVIFADDLYDSAHFEPLTANQIKAEGVIRFTSTINAARPNGTERAWFWLPDGTRTNTGEVELAAQSPILNNFAAGTEPNAAGEFVTHTVLLISSFPQWSRFNPRYLRLEQGSVGTELSGKQVFTGSSPATDAWVALQEFWLVPWGVGAAAPA